MLHTSGLYARHKDYREAATINLATCDAVVAQLLSDWGADPIDADDAASTPRAAIWPWPAALMRLAALIKGIAGA
jgi:hypothetical protein